MNLIKAYDRCLTRRPITTKVITSSFLCGLGDYICQNYVEKKVPGSKYNYKRTLVMLSVGAYLQLIIKNNR